MWRNSTATLSAIQIVTKARNDTKEELKQSSFSLEEDGGATI